MNKILIFLLLGTVCVSCCARPYRRDYIITDTSVQKEVKEIVTAD